MTKETGSEMKKHVRKKRKSAHELRELRLKKRLRQLLDKLLRLEKAVADLKTRTLKDKSDSS